MPEGPSIVILRERGARASSARRIVAVEGNTRHRQGSACVGERIVALRSWGKHFLVELPGFALRVHFLLFGSYRIDERKDRPRRAWAWASPTAASSTSTPARCSYIEGPTSTTSTTGAATSCPTPGTRRRRGASSARMPDTLACDALLDQDVFAGVGNIIKNEVLFRIRVHPLSHGRRAAAAQARASWSKQARDYSFDFLEWKKAFVLRKHWLAHTKRTCPRCAIPFVKAHLGTTAPAQLLLRALPEALRRLTAGRAADRPPVSGRAGSRAIRHGSRGQARPGAADNFAIPVCPVLAGTAMKKARPTDRDRRPGAARRHVRPSRHRLDVASVSAQQLSHRDAGAAGDDPLARPAHRALEPAAERPGRRGGAPATTLPGPLPVAPATPPTTPASATPTPSNRAVRAAAEDNVVDAAAHARQRAQAERARKLAASATPSSAASASSPRPRATAGRRSTWSRGKPQEARAQAEALSRALRRQDARRAGPVHPPAHRRRRRQGVDACA